MAGALELAAELGQVETVLGDFAFSEENDRDVHVVERAKRFVGIDVHFAQAGTELAQQRCHLSFGFVAEMAALARVQRDFYFRRGLHLAFAAHPLCYISRILYNDNAGDLAARNIMDIEGAARGGEMGRVVALVEDIFFLAKMKETAKQTDVTLETAGTAEALAEAARADTTSLLIVDLNARGSIEAIEMLNAAGNTLPVIAFFSHVQAELAERARVAGCKQVMPRSKFTRELAEILTRAKAK